MTRNRDAQIFSNFQFAWTSLRVGMDVGSTGGATRMPSWTPAALELLGWDERTLRQLLMVFGMQVRSRVF